VEVNLFALPPSPLTGNLPSLFTAYGSDHLRSETLIAYEVGYRGLWTERLAVDAAFFYNDYDHLILVSPDAPSIKNLDSITYLLFPLVGDNPGAGYNTGLELAAEWRPTDDWRLRLSYVHSHSNMQQGVDTIYELGQRQQISVSSAWNLEPNLELDVWWRYVNGFDVNTFSALGTIKIEPQSSLNFRLGWRPRQDLELSLVGTNLLDSSRVEFAAEALTAFPVAIERSLYGQIKWSF
jgi:iron complex outermembrane receptor protein